jgi:hypothetical protein
MGRLNIEQLLNKKIFKELDLNKITEKQMSEIYKVLDVFDTKTIKNRLVNIRDFIKYGVEDDWLGRIEIIRNTIKNDVTSDYSLEIRYGKNNIDKIKSSFKEKYSITKNKFINKFGEIEGPKKWEEYLVNSKTPWGLGLCINKFGEIEGPKKWGERLNKKIKTMSERKKIKPYRNGRTLVEYQNRYGVELGFKYWDERNKRQSYVNSKEYYVSLYGEIEGPKKWEEFTKSMDKTSLKSFKGRHGDEVGEKLYEKHITRIKYTSTIDYYKEKYGDELGALKYHNLLLRKLVSFNGYSKISQQLFWSIYEKFNGDVSDMYFAELNDEYVIYTHEEWSRVIKLDFKFGNKIIEFDGDYWHSKPEQIEKDKLRNEFLLSKGYELLRIKEGEFRKTPLLITEKCLKFITQ